MARFCVGQKVRLRHKPKVSFVIEDVDQVRRWAKLKGVTIFPSGHTCEWFTWASYNVLELVDATQRKETQMADTAETTRQDPNTDIDGPSESALKGDTD